MLAEVIRWRHGSGIFKACAQELFTGTRLAGKLRERKKKWLGNAPSVDHENRDSLFGARALKNHRVQILKAPRKLRLAAQRFPAARGQAADLERAGVMRGVREAR